ncbi:MAG: efflux RND transporter periplasmic adaptor subunit [Ferruginibacter sp.]|nr:efflux RND transporter periplasmic adaptor subunit [Cytophagales bacterium]
MKTTTGTIREVSKKWGLNAWLTILLGLFSGPGFSHDGENHGEQSPAGNDRGQSYFSVFTTSEVFELILRYEPIKSKAPTVMRLFIADFETNQAVDSARIEVTTLENASLRFTVQRIEPGIYTLTGTFPADSTYTLVANVAAGEKADLMTLENIGVGKRLPEAGVAESASPLDWKIILLIAGGFLAGTGTTYLLMRRREMARRLAGSVLVLVAFALPLNPTGPAFAHDGENHGGDDQQARNSTPPTDEVETPKETQFLFDMRTAFSRLGDYSNVLQLYGKVLPVNNGEVKIVAPQNSSVVSLKVRIGQRVRKGQPLAVIRQNLTTSEQIALATERSSANAELEAAQKDYQRLKSIEDIAARKDVQQAEIRYHNARNRKRLYDTLSSGEGTGSKSTVLVSPIDGIVDNFNLSVGQQVSQGAQLFSVYDNQKLKIEAQVFDRDAAKITPDIRFSVESLQPGRPPETARLVAFGGVVNPVNQSAQIILEVDNAERVFRPGQFVNVEVLAKTEHRQLVVPTSAVSDIDGKPVVFVHTSPERFKVRYVQVGEGNRVQTTILKGLTEKERVVTSGAYQVKSIYLNQ